MANLATQAGVEGRSIRVHAPLMSLDKAAIIREGISLGVNYGMTSSCYQPTKEYFPCGGCDACLLRARGFEQAGVLDPLIAS